MISIVMHFFILYKKGDDKMLPNRTSASLPLVTPRMTYYTRVIDNLTEEQVLGWVSTARNKDIFYGRVSEGGESEYIIEYDIYNNEPYGWDANGPSITCMDAYNCSLYINIPYECRDLSPFLYVRCITYNPQAEWKPLDMGHPVYKDIQGRCSPDFGVILGTGDHAVIQTKIKLKKGANICKLQYNFELRFTYQFGE
jgi:hypothetical protein